MKQSDFDINQNDGVNVCGDSRNDLVENNSNIVLDSKNALFENVSYNQGQNDFGARGTCGPTSVANSLNRVTGTSDYTENEVLHCAMDNHLCLNSSNPYNMGGTTTENIVLIIDQVKSPESDINVVVFEYDNALSVNELADKVEYPNTIAIVGVDSATLWDQRGDVASSGLFQQIEFPSDHWITVDSPTRDNDGNLTGFNIIDSGGGIDYVDKGKFEAMYLGDENYLICDPTAIIISNNNEIINKYDLRDGVISDDGYKKCLNESREDILISGLFDNKPDVEYITATEIDGLVKDIEHVDLPLSLITTFTDNQYRTVETTEPVTVYRIYGGDANIGGAFTTTVPSISEDDSRQKSALLPEWNNTCEYEAKIEIPKGEVLNIGTVKEQVDSKTGQKYLGGGDQILMPANWYINHPEWVVEIRKLK